MALKFWKPALSAAVFVLWALPAAATSIRTTSPGTIVFRGGAIVPRYFVMRDVAGPYHFTHHRLLIYGAYSPTPRTLVEMEAPFEKMPDQDLAAGNVTVWGKYRFYRTVGEWGDKHAAVRAGLNLPTGQSRHMPGLPAVVASQLQPSAGAWSPTIELTWGQAIRRFIYHLDAQQTFGVERAGVRPGHTTRANLDLEYVLLPRKYTAPGKEVFVVLEITGLHQTAIRAAGLSGGATGGTRMLIAPGIQYVAARRLVLEASFQFAAYSSTGPLQLRNKNNLLAGIRWLF